MFRFLPFLVLLLLKEILSSANGNEKVPPALLAKANQDRLVNITITFGKDFNPASANRILSKNATREDKLNHLCDSLKDEADRSQKGVLDILSRRTRSNRVDIKPFWISNQIVIRNADVSIIESISKDDEVVSIEEEAVLELVQTGGVNEAVINSQNPWGIRKIEAAAAWAELGQKGEGIVVGVIDTGVRQNHEALRDNFLGEYGWLDPYQKTSAPVDTDGHGTHCTGTIVGAKGIGVSPGAKWAACRGCSTRGCGSAELLACGQFFACPTLSDGSRRDCSKAPHIVSNSWGGGQGNTFFSRVIEAWRAAGIIPVFAAGNDGPSCRTASSPGDYSNVISVGSTTERDGISGFSSIGPTIDGRMKPDVVAPGSGVLSAYIRSDSSYARMDGTSMACPHVAGVIALLKGGNKELSFDQIRRLLTDNADRSLSLSGKTCNGIRDNVFPNHVFGSGRVNALKSARALKAGQGSCPTWFGCHEGYCWAGCNPTGARDDWCWTTKGTTKDYTYVRCNRASDCNSCWACAGNCGT